MTYKYEYFSLKKILFVCNRIYWNQHTMFMVKTNLLELDLDAIFILLFCYFLALFSWVKVAVWLLRSNANIHFLSGTNDSSQDKSLRSRSVQLKNLKDAFCARILRQKEICCLVFFSYFLLISKSIVLVVDTSPLSHCFCRTINSLIFTSEKFTFIAQKCVRVAQLTYFSATYCTHLWANTFPIILSLSNVSASVSYYFFITRGNPVIRYRYSCYICVLLCFLPPRLTDDYRFTCCRIHTYNVVK